MNAAIRAHPRSRIHNEKTFAVTGPQCDMGDVYWGSLYGENFGGMMTEVHICKSVSGGNTFGNSCN